MVQQPPHSFPFVIVCGKYTQFAVGLLHCMLILLLLTPCVHARSAVQTATVNPSSELGARIVDLEKRLLSHPGDADHWIELGNLYFDAGVPAKAIAAYRQALMLRPNNANVLTDLGIMYRETARYNEAVQSFKKAIRLNPAHQNAMFNLGVVLYFDLHQHEEGKLVWQRLVRMNPQAMTSDGQSVAALLNTLSE